MIRLNEYRKAMRKVKREERSRISQQHRLEKPTPQADPGKTSAKRQPIPTPRTHAPVTPTAEEEEDAVMDVTVDGQVDHTIEEIDIFLQPPSDTTS